MKVAVKARKKLTIFLEILFIMVIFLNLANVVWKNNDKYFSFDYWQRFPSLEFIYKNSQYVTKTSASWIPDEVIYAYNGPALIKGGTPILIVPD